MEVKTGFKQTELGVFPVEWDVRPLGQLSEFITSGSRGWAKHYSDRGPLFVRSQNIRDGHLDFTERQCVIPPSGAEGSRTRLKCSDLLITITGNSVGNVAWVNRDIGEAYISQHVGLIRLLNPSIAEYLCLFLAPGSPGNRQILVSQTGQSKPGLNLKNLEDFLVTHPPLHEQRYIATALSDLDALITGLDQLIAKKRDLKQAAMQQLLTGQRRLMGFSGEWELKLFGELFQFLKTANNSRADLSPLEEVGYIHYGDIHTTDSAFLDCSSSELPMISMEKVTGIPFVEDGDIVMADASEDYNGIGKSMEIRGVGNRKVVAGLHTFLLRGDSRFLANGFKGYIQFMPAVRTALVQLATGISVYGVSKNNVRGIEIALPKLGEQVSIATVLSAMDTEIAALESRREKTCGLKEGMMQELLTGRIRLV